MRPWVLPCVFFLFAFPGAALARPPLAWEAFTLHLRSGDDLPAERAWIEVPEHHDRPDGPAIRLPLVRLKATGPHPGVPLLWLAGGPGESGIRRIVTSYPLFEKLRVHGDVIVFDQRGTGAAEPSLAMQGNLDLPAMESIDSDAARRRLAAMAGDIRRTIASRGLDLSAFNTAESADDVDTIRQALGVEQVALVAHSYGTHLALAVIKRHGAHVARAVLGGVNGLDDRWREPRDGDRWLERVAAKVRDDHAWATRDPDFTDKVRRVLDALGRDPIVASTQQGEVLIGETEIQVLVTLLSGDLDFIRGMPQLFDDLEKRTHVDAIAALVQRAIRQRPIGTAMTYAMHVASGVSDQRERDIATQARTAIFGDAVNWGIGEQAFVAALGVADLGRDFRRPFHSGVPVLLISGTLDGRTSDKEARRVARQFDHATTITIDGASHDFFFRAPPPGLSESMDAFLDGKAVADRHLGLPVGFRPPG